MKKQPPPPTADELARQLQEFDAVMVLPEACPWCKERAGTHLAEDGWDRCNNCGGN